MLDFTEVESMSTEYESGSSWMVRGFSNLALLAVVALAFRLHDRHWPDEGGFLWSLGYALGRLSGDNDGLVILLAGTVCAVIAATLQLIRVLFRTSRR